MFFSQLTLLRQIFEKKGYPRIFINRSLKFYSNPELLSLKKVSAAEKKPLQLVLLFLGTIL